jgi:hypothetical protein
MAQAKTALMVGLAMVVIAALMTTGARAQQTNSIRRGPPSAAGCYWRIHPRTHELRPPPAVLTEARYGLWLVAALPNCGPVPLRQLASRWTRLLVSPWH